MAREESNREKEDREEMRTGRREKEIARRIISSQE